MHQRPVSSPPGPQTNSESASPGIPSKAGDIGRKGTAGLILYPLSARRATLDLPEANLQQLGSLSKSLKEIIAPQKKPYLGSLLPGPMIGRKQIVRYTTGKLRVDWLIGLPPEICLWLLHAENGPRTKPKEDTCQNHVPKPRFGPTVKRLARSAPRL